MSDELRDETNPETDHEDDLHGGVDEFDVDAYADETFPEDAEQRIEDEDLDTTAVESDEHEDEPDSESADDSAEEIPRFARLAGWFGFLLPPVGAVMGHLFLAWEGKDKDVPGRRHAVTGVIIGWTLTFVLGVTALIGGTLWYESGEEARIQEAREQIAQEELARVLEEAVDSPSAGAVDAQSCDAVFGVLNPETQPEEVSDLVERYEAITDGETPNTEIYTDYAGYLSGFDSPEDFADIDESEAQEREAQTESVMGALNEDSLACVALDEGYFMDNIADRNTTEF